ncbi:hypothetical protein BU14_2539s0001, partial [Porphyra umbilicalis]
AQGRDRVREPRERRPRRQPRGDPPRNERRPRGGAGRLPPPPGAEDEEHVGGDGEARAGGAPQEEEEEAREARPRHEKGAGGAADRRARAGGGEGDEAEAGGGRGEQRPRHGGEGEEELAVGVVGEEKVAVGAERLEEEKGEGDGDEEDGGEGKGGERAVAEAACQPPGRHVMGGAGATRSEGGQRSSRRQSWATTALCPVQREGPVPRWTLAVTKPPRDDSAATGCPQHTEWLARNGARAGLWPRFRGPRGPAATARRSVRVAHDRGTRQRPALPLTSIDPVVLVKLGGFSQASVEPFGPHIVGGRGAAAPRRCASAPGRRTAALGGRRHRRAPRRPRLLRPPQPDPRLPRDRRRLVPLHVPHLFPRPDASRRAPGRSPAPMADDLGPPAGVRPPLSPASAAGAAAAG